jgi:lipoprotein signal peptidase
LAVNFGGYPDEFLMAALLRNKEYGQANKLLSEHKLQIYMFAVLVLFVFSVFYQHWISNKPVLGKQIKEEDGCKGLHLHHNHGHSHGNSHIKKEGYNTL